MNDSSVYTINGDDLIDSTYNYDEFVAIIETVKRNPNKDFEARDFILKNRILKEKTEEDIEFHLFNLENLNVIRIEKQSDYPIRKYRININERNTVAFLKIVDNKFELDVDLSKDEYFELLKDIQSQTKQKYYSNLLEYWERNIGSVILKIERIEYFTKERNKQIEQFESDKNLLKFYNVKNLEKLADDLYFAYRARRKIPLNPNWYFRGISSRNHLEIALESRFKQWYQIQTLNELIERELDTSKNKIVDSDNLMELESGDIRRKSVNIHNSTDNSEQSIPKQLRDIFLNPTDLEPCLDILRQLDITIIDAENCYIGKQKKGIFPIWISVLQKNKPKLIHNYSFMVYKNLLNIDIKGLNLSEDASEFRKTYKSLERYSTDIKVLLSQFSQSGKVGKLTL